MEDGAMKLGLLLESAHAQQAFAESVLDKLRAHVSELGGIAREEIRSTLIEELHTVGEDSRRAAETLRRLRHVANLRTALWSLAMTGLSCAVPLICAWWLLPSRGDVAALITKRDSLKAEIAELQERGGQAELRHCGTGRRLCVRVDQTAGAFGASGDYLIVKGY